MSDVQGKIVTKNKDTALNRKRKLPDSDVQSPGARIRTPVTATVKGVKGKAQSKKNDEDDDDIEDEDNSDEQDDDDDDDDEVETKQQTGKSSASSGITKEAASNDTARKDDRDSKTLFVKNLPSNCSVKQIKALSKDVKQVRIRTAFSVVNKKRTRIVYAYLEFANEETAEINHHILSESVVKGNKLLVDYVGSKSSFISNRQKTEPGDIDPLRLYVTGLPENTTEDDLRTLFPKATEFVLPKRKKDKKVFGYAFIGFDCPELAKQFHSSGQELNLRDSKLVVLYAKQRKERTLKVKKSAKKTQAKKGAGKVAVKGGDDDDDDDDDQENSDAMEDSDDDDEGGDDDDDDDDDDDE